MNVQRCESPKDPSSRCSKHKEKAQNHQASAPIRTATLSLYLTPSNRKSNLLLNPHQHPFTHAPSQPPELLSFRLPKRNTHHEQQAKKQASLKKLLYTFKGIGRLASQSFLDHVTVTLVICWRARRPLGHRRTDGSAGRHAAGSVAEFA
jgi:hypothetical protein